VGESEDRAHSLETRCSSVSANTSSGVLSSRMRTVQSPDGILFYQHRSTPYTEIVRINPRVYFYVDVKEVAFVVQSPPGSKNSVSIWTEVALRNPFSGRFVFFPPYSYTHYPETGSQ